MASSLRQVKLTPGRFDKKAPSMKGLLLLGKTKPVLARNEKLEKTWESLLVDPPVNYGDSNQFRTVFPDIRPSSFPFCPRKYAFGKFGLRMPDTFNVKSNFYTAIGTAIHYVVQNAFARTGRLWGLWACPRPECRTKFSEEPSTYPEGEVCPKCGWGQLEYAELTIEDPEIGLLGHVDGVMLLPKRQSILEAKSTADEKVSKLKKMSSAEISRLFITESPWYGYLSQALTYAALIRKKYPTLMTNLTTVDYAIFSRDDPTNVAFVTLDVPTDDSWYNEIKARVLMAREAVVERILPIGFAETEEDLKSQPACVWCDYKEVCLNPKGKVRYGADALYHIGAREGLQELLVEERKKLMGTIIRGDMVESNEVFVPKDEDAEAAEKAKAEKEEAEEASAAEG